MESENHLINNDVPLAKPIKIFSEENCVGLLQGQVILKHEDNRTYSPMYIHNNPHNESTRSQRKYTYIVVGAGGASEDRFETLRD